MDENFICILEKWRSFKGFENTNIRTKLSLLALVFIPSEVSECGDCKGVQMYLLEINWKNIFTVSAWPPLTHVSQITPYSEGSSIPLLKWGNCIQLPKSLKLLFFLLHRSLKYLVIVVIFWLVSFLIPRPSTGSVLFTLLSPSWILLVEDSKVWRVKPRWELQHVKLLCLFWVSKFYSLRIRWWGTQEAFCTPEWACFNLRLLNIAAQWSALTELHNACCIFIRTSSSFKNCSKRLL